ncbi:hypothetical protein [Salirhabdus sp. Marseille-P4669]|uniref:hypothetical protein n=1 Tax=Salirhabdus sp. Marseille-P4669 TaxID=2042310 RepID=UPI000C7BC645|nr:hypothetical protein [Salirhabdus sp. Marseille-P4669]
MKKAIILLIILFLVGCTNDNKGSESANSEFNESVKTAQDISPNGEIEKVDNTTNDETEVDSENESKISSESEKEFHSVYSAGFLNVSEDYGTTEFRINLIRLGMSIEEASLEFGKPDSIDDMTGQANWSFVDGSYVVAFVMDSKINHIVGSVPLHLVSEKSDLGLGEPTAVDNETNVMYYYRGSDQYLSAFRVNDRMQFDLQYVDERVKSLHN